MFRFDLKALAAAAPSAGAFVGKRRVLFQDIDAAGIVFFSRVLDYFHDNYVEFLDQAGDPLATVLREKRWAAPLRQVEAQYFRPLKFGAELEVRIVAAELQETRVTLGHHLAFADGKLAGEVAAVGQTLHVFVDPVSFQPIPVPPGLQRAFAALGRASGQDQALSAADV